jgi:hypothetical protein
MMIQMACFDLIDIAKPRQIYGSVDRVVKGTSMCYNFLTTTAAPDDFWPDPDPTFENVKIRPRFFWKFF